MEFFSTLLYICTCYEERRVREFCACVWNEVLRRLAACFSLAFTVRAAFAAYSKSFNPIYSNIKYLESTIGFYLLRAAAMSVLCAVQKKNTNTTQQLYMNVCMRSVRIQIIMIEAPCGCGPVRQSQHNYNYEKPTAHNDLVISLLYDAMSE